MNYGLHVVLLLVLAFSAEIVGMEKNGKKPNLSDVQFSLPTKQEFLKSIKKDIHIALCAYWSLFKSAVYDGRDELKKNESIELWSANIHYEVITQLHKHTKNTEKMLFLSLGATKKHLEDDIYVENTGIMFDTNRIVCEPEEWMAQLNDEHYKWYTTKTYPLMVDYYWPKNKSHNSLLKENEVFDKAK